MQILIGCAKKMTTIIPRLISRYSDPAFLPHANRIAMRMSRYSPDELRLMLRCNDAIARENWFRYRSFIDPGTRRPAIFCYDGIVFKKIDPESMSNDDLDYADSHLLIGSFLYGLLRPLDRINPYRLEGDVVLNLDGREISLFDYWKPILTDWLIKTVKADDGILLNLASAEFKQLFDWDRVERELTVITPEFLVEKDGKLKNITVYTKMCRGAMARWVILNRISDPSLLTSFDYEGFTPISPNKFILQS